MTIGKKIQESELILNPDGSVYHLKIKPENLADHVILVGDPKRVGTISDFFDTTEFEGQNREICTHTGTYKGKRITAMSTGMGTDNIDIVINELDALVNINLKTRTINPQHKSLNLFRLGTSGAVQSDLPLNAFVVSEFGLGFDGMLYYYSFDEGITCAEMKDEFIKHTNWNPNLPNPYIIPASPSLLKMFSEDDIYKGITVTAPGFYGPQGRELRIPLAHPDMNKNLESFNYKNHRILNYEMETSALYGLGNILGHQTLTICVAIANRRKKAYNQNYQVAIKELIELLLDKIVQQED